jgi:hypothetical protein
VPFSLAGGEHWKERRSSKGRIQDRAPKFGARIQNTWILKMKRGGEERPCLSSSWADSHLIDARPAKRAKECVKPFLGQAESKLELGAKERRPVPEDLFSENEYGLGKTPSPYSFSGRAHGERHWGGRVHPHPCPSLVGRRVLLIASGSLCARSCWVESKLEHDTKEGFQFQVLITAATRGAST